MATRDSPKVRSPRTTFHRLIDRYLDHLVLASGRSTNTLLAYRRDLARYVAFCTARAINHPREVTPQVVGEFLVGLTRDRLSPASLARTLSAVKNFHRYLVQSEVCPDNPARPLRTPRLPRKLPDVLSVRQMMRLVNAPSTDDTNGLRDRAILAVLYGCGLRVSEAAGLAVDDVDFQSQFMRVRGKGDRERLVPFGEMTRRALTAYLNGPARRDVETESDRIFLSRRRAGLTRMGIWLIVKRAAKAAGLSSRVTPHTFRHSFATHLVQGGADLRAVQMMLGHRSVSTTQIYTHLDNAHLRKVHTQFHPLEQVGRKRPN